MNKLIILSIVIISVIASCGPSQSELEKLEKDKADSIAKVAEKNKKEIEENIKNTVTQFVQGQIFAINQENNQTSGKLNSIRIDSIRNVGKEYLCSYSFYYTPDGIKKDSITDGKLFVDSLFNPVLTVRK